MERERIGRHLSAGMGLAGVVLFIGSIALSDMVSAIFGVVGAGIGLTFYSASNWIFGTNIDVDLTEPHSFKINLVQLGLVLFAFAFLTYFIGNFQTVTSVFRTGIPSPPYPAYAGLLVGVFLGGGVAYLTQRWDTLSELSQSVPVRMVGFSFTFGTFLVLLVYQPTSSVLYAGAYTVSRLAVILGVYLLS